jgi:hypothetical protein
LPARSIPEYVEEDLAKDQQAQREENALELTLREREHRGAPAIDGNYGMMHTTNQVCPEEISRGNRHKPQSWKSRSAATCGNAQWNKAMVMD